MAGGVRIRHGTALAVFGLVVVAVGFLASASVAKGDAGASLEGGQAQFQLFVQVDSDFDLAESGTAIPMQVLVTDLRGIPQAGVPVRLIASAGAVQPDLVVTDPSGRASFTFLAQIGETRTVRITAITELAGAAQGIDAFTVRVVRLPPPPILARAEAFSLGFLSGILLFLSSTETGRYALFGAFFPLYTRLKREEVLEHFVRGQVFGVIQSQPGANFTAIKTLLGLSNGTLSYHLRTLEATGFVVARWDGPYKRFFPADLGAAAKVEGLRISELQRRLLERLRESPEVAQRDLARELAVTQQCVSYNLRILRRLGLVLKARSGRRHRYLVLES